MWIYKVKSTIIASNILEYKYKVQNGCYSLLEYKSQITFRIFVRPVTLWCFFNKKNKIKLHLKDEDFYFEVSRYEMKRVQ